MTRIRRWHTALLAASGVAAAALFCLAMLSTDIVLPDVATERCTGALQRPVDQVVLLLIDALRADFVLPQLQHAYTATSGVCGRDGDGNNKGGDGAAVAVEGNASSPAVERAWLTYIASSLSDRHDASHGSFLVADTPTTTAQRVKAIATGTIPAFIECSSNFQPTRVSMDSMLQQVAGRAVLLGDDTWIKLFSHDAETKNNNNNSNNNNSNSSSDNNNTSADVAVSRLWKYAVPTASFDVSDFHSNDDTILSHLYAVLAKEVVDTTSNNNNNSDSKSSSSAAASEADTSLHAQLIIAHFLGVDHIGHRHHATHADMQHKLRQLDEMLYNVSRTLRARRAPMRTLLLVLGDHGMTNSGDHGGATAQETDTFLFAQVFDTTAAATHHVDSDDDGNNNDEDKDKRVTRLHARAAARVRDLAAQRWSPRDAVDAELASRFAPCRDVLVNGSHDARDTTLRDKTSVAYQVDLAATVTMALQRPLPFSSVGRAMPEVLALVDADVDVARAQRCNLRQLRRYASTARITSMLSLGACRGVDDRDEEADNNNKDNDSNSTDAAHRVRRCMAAMGEYARYSHNHMNLTGMRAAIGVLVAACVVTAAVTVVRAVVAVATTTTMPAAQRACGSKRDTTHSDAVHLRLPQRLQVVVVALLRRLSLSDTWAAYALLLRLLLVFSNSFIVNEDTQLCSLLAALLLPLVLMRLPALREACRTRLLSRRVTNNSSSADAKDDKASATKTRTATLSPLSCSRQVADHSALAWLLLVLLVLRIVIVPGALRRRAHVTHDVDAHSTLDRHLAALLHYADMRSSNSSRGGGGDDVLAWGVWLAVRVVTSTSVRLCCGGVLSWYAYVRHCSTTPRSNSSSSSSSNRHTLSPHTALYAFATMVVLMAAVQTVQLWHHIVPLCGCVAWVYWSRRRARASLQQQQQRALRVHAQCCGDVLLVLYPVVVLWTSTLCGAEASMAAVAWLTMLGGLCLPRLMWAAQTCSDGTVTTTSSSSAAVAVRSAYSPAAQSVIAQVAAYVAFFASGQQCVLSTIDWNAAFVGLDRFRLYAGGVFVIMRTFGPFFCTPLACSVAACLRQRLTCRDDDDTDIDNDNDNNTCPRVQEAQHTTAVTAAWSVLHSLVLVMVAQVAVSCASAYLQRGHLMLYVIFCPKLVYDCVALVVVSCGVAAAHACEWLTRP